MQFIFRMTTTDGIVGLFLQIQTDGLQTTDNSEDVAPGLSSQVQGFFPPETGGAHIIPGVECRGRFCYPE